MGMLDWLGLNTTNSKREHESRNECHAPDRWQIVTDATMRKHYRRNPHSFADLLSIGEYLPDSQTYEMRDLRSHAVVLEITSIPTEGRSDDELVELREAVINAFSNTFSMPTLTPFIMQTYAYKEDNLTEFFKETESFISPDIRDTVYTQKYLTMMKKHMKGISKPGGIFYDEMVTKSQYRGQQKKVKIILYRHVLASEKNVDSAEEINNLTNNFISQIQSTGVVVNRVNGEAFQSWLLSWFNPKPAITNGDISQLHELAQYPQEDKKPLNYSIAENVVYSQPISDPDEKCWYFDGVPHQYIRVATLQKQPYVGQITGEISKGVGKALQSTALIDSLPDGAMWHQTIILCDQRDVDNKIVGLKGVGKSETEESIAAEQAIDSLIDSRTVGTQHYLASMGMFVRADITAEPSEYKASLKRNRDKVTQLLLSNGLRPMTIESDAVQVESYIPHLPMNYAVKDDPYGIYMGLYFDADIINLLPIWGREVGTGNAGMINANRGGEPQTFDMFGKDKVRSSHGVLIGPQGSGKSATLVSIAEAVMAVYRPRLTILEKGNSFRLLGDYFKRYGLTVQRIALGSKRQRAYFCPYLESHLIFDERYNEQEVDWDELDEFDDIDEEENAEDDDDSAKREPLTEMLTATIIMVTGGNPEQAKQLTETHKAMFSSAITLAAERSQKLQQQTITSDVCDALSEVIENSQVQESVKAEMRNYLEALNGWTKGDRGRLFNQRGKTFDDDVDVTILDIGQYDAEAKAAELSVIYIALSTHLFNIGEKYQNSGRDTVYLQDETHVFTDKPLLAPYMATAVKLMRKIGLKALYATQNVSDFKNGAEKILKLVEWWILLNPSEVEVEEAGVYRTLSNAQKSMILSTTKQKAAYTEGIVMGNKKVVGEMLTRFVPPSEQLARAMTEPEEKAERKQLRDQYGFNDDIEASEFIAYKLDVARNIVNRDDDSAIREIKDRNAKLLASLADKKAA
ncbi:conjugative transfer ATPase [Photobacterium sp. GB-72]|uniref:conjugative transfer ATPase n=1 Tax=Photobacterium sp. GB-72 TaxID=2022105 RepID=UPI000D1635E0|nr:conjugative transfer ATPase [Photobacterium sp. GB-72]PSV28066.1 conjugative transfer ATPase [Photobacterium sp. GB-72]